MVDAREFPRDKACGDGLTPRAVVELRGLGLGEWLDGRIQHHGLRLTGFGSEVEIPWPGQSFPPVSSAVPRTELDERVRTAAEESGAQMLLGCKAVDARRDSAGRVSEVVLSDGRRVACRWLIVADGARSTLGRALGRQWHQQTVYGVAARAYLRSPRAAEPWISSDLELRSAEDQVLPGYGWIFPLGNGEVNLGVGTLATDKRPADVALRALIRRYTELNRRSLLPMGGAVSGVAGPNWMLVGDAAGCVNPLNGEGIDYGLETGRLAADFLYSGDAADMSLAWPALLQQHYARGFSVARRLGLLLTLPRFLPTVGPFGMRSARLMDIAVRVMGNLVTDEDADAVARLWRAAGTGSRLVDRRKPFA